MSYIKFRKLLKNLLFRVGFVEIETGLEKIDTLKMFQDNLLIM